MTTISAAELARRTRHHQVRIDPQLAAYFLGYWLEHGLVEEPLPGRYRLTARGHRAGDGLLDIDLGELFAA